jgi:hypothetical protein
MGRSFTVLQAIATHAGLTACVRVGGPSQVISDDEFDLPTRVYSGGGLLSNRDW